MAREKSIDYTTKIYAVSIREMCGIKPHQQLKEVSAEERYTPIPVALSNQIHPSCRSPHRALTLSSQLTVSDILKS